VLAVFEAVLGIELTRKAIGLMRMGENEGSYRQESKDGSPGRHSSDVLSNELIHFDY
jgi:hypothetical protein